MKGKRLLIPEETPITLKQVITESWDSEPTKRPTFTTIRRDLEAIL